MSATYLQLPSQTCLSKSLKFDKIDILSVKKGL